MWDSFIYFAVPALLFWATGALAAWRDKKAIVYSATIVGIIIFFAYIVMMWMELERPPLRTMGETRLWYSFFLPVAGIVIYSRWKYKWLLSFSTIMALVFICINLFKPEIHSKTLMPALQSPWFAPHVIVYMFAYSLFGLAALMALWELWSKKEWHEDIDPLVYVAYALLTLGMLMGALWAKEAWGHYWAWDPKETWAAITWFTYLAYIHLRRLPSSPPYTSELCSSEHQLERKSGGAGGGFPKWSMILLIVAFCLLQMCWWGVNYLPSAQGMSVHTYSIQ